MPVALEKSVEIRARLVEAINEGVAIDEFTVRKLQHEIKNEKSYVDKAMLNALFNVATRNYIAAYDSFNSYIRLNNSLESHTDYLIFLTQMNDYDKAYNNALELYDRFGRSYGATYLIQLYNIFKAVSDISMMRLVCDDLEAVQSEHASSLKHEVEGFKENYETFLQLTNTQDGELQNVLLAAYSVINAVVLQGGLYGMDVDEIQYHKIPAQKECGIIMALRNTTVELAADMNYQLTDKLLERDAFPKGNWSLWFEPAIQ